MIMILYIIVIIIFKIKKVLVRLFVKNMIFLNIDLLLIFMIHWKMLLIFCLIIYYKWMLINTILLLKEQNFNISSLMIKYNFFNQKIIQKLKNIKLLYDKKVLIYHQKLLIKIIINIHIRALWYIHFCQFLC